LIQNPKVIITMKDNYSKNLVGCLKTTISHCILVLRMD